MEMRRTGRPPASRPQNLRQWCWPVRCNEEAFYRAVTSRVPEWSSDWRIQPPLLGLLLAILPNGEGCQNSDSPQDPTPSVASPPRDHVAALRSAPKPARPAPAPSAESRRRSRTRCFGTKRRSCAGRWRDRRSAPSIASSSPPRLTSFRGTGGPPSSSRPRRCSSGTANSSGGSGPTAPRASLDVLRSIQTSGHSCSASPGRTRGGVTSGSKENRGRSASGWRDDHQKDASCSRTRSGSSAPGPHLV